MTETLTLPTGETVTPDEPFLYEGYPYRFRPAEDGPAFYLSPLYWGGGEMDIPIAGRSALEEQWGPESRGVLSAAEWTEWLEGARDDDRFDGAELDHLARELGVADAPGPLSRLRRALGL